MAQEFQIGITKKILENLRSPAQLDDHPWAKNQFVQEFVEKNPALEGKSRGCQLAMAVADLFIRMIPGAPPKRGKRLDTHWGAYGLLAAQYFAPYLFGLPYPNSLRNAWGTIDQAILLFRFGKDKLDSLSDEEISRYKLIGDELEVAPLSTISDWHRKGIELLADVISDREHYLSQSPSSFSEPFVIQTGSRASETDVSEVDPAPAIKTSNRNSRLWILGGILLILTAALIFFGVKAYRIYRLAEVLQDDLSQIRDLASNPLDTARLRTAGVLLEKAGTDIRSLQAETSPYLRTIGPWLTWVPEYGQDLAASADLLEMADQFMTAAHTIFRVGYPFFEAVQAERTTLDPKNLTALLVQAQPQLIQARRELDPALTIRDRLNIAEFSTRTQGLLKEMDRPLRLVDDGLSLATALPKILGASSDGPKTYLLLVQNEDELRSTGGFITSIGTFVVRNGDLFGLEFEDSGEQEDWSLPYPDAPWQLQQYMNSPVLVLRDANWFTDFPTSVRWIEYLYAYNHQHSVDGIIAFDQQMLVALLDVIGPLPVEDYSVPITAENVIRFMREAKKTPSYTEQGVIRKPFINQIGSAIVQTLTSNSEEIDWRKLAEKMMQMLNERHILLQFDDPQLTVVLANWSFDGAVKAGAGDFLMVVDSNIGFNKTNAVIDQNTTYDVDLTNPQKPASTLVIFQGNQSPGTQSCIQYGGHENESKYPIHYCYWDYMRVYVPAGTQLNGATPHQIPADWMILKEVVPARVDHLDEKIDGVEGYGTLVVVPGGQTLGTQFEFSLPGRVVAHQPGTNFYTYTLKIQKQPGTAAVPLTLRVHLPASAHVESVNLTAVVRGSNILVETNLRSDVNLTVVFSLP